MGYKDLSSGLQLLAEDDTQRSKIARLRDVIEEVERAMGSGVKRTAIVAELKKHGLEMSAATFRGTLQRLRAQRRPSTVLLSTGPPGSTDPVDRLVGNSQDAAAAQFNHIEPHLNIPPHEPTDQPMDRSHDPIELQKAMRGKPNLAELSKLARKAP